MTQEYGKGFGRRRVLLGGAATTIASLAMPGILRAQTRELVIGGAASHKPWVETHVMPMFEKKYNCKITFEGTRSLVNLEKMQKNRDKPYMSVVQMDDPVMILAVREGLLEPITAAKAPNLAKLKPGTTHMDGMWANYLQPWQGVAYNTNVLKTAPASWTDALDPKFKGRIIVPSLQNTEGLPNLFMFAHLATGKPMAEAYKDIDAAFRELRKLKPNLLTVYSQMPQAFSLLEQGEAHMILGALSSFGMQRRLDGAPITMTAPKEGIFPVPSGIAVIKNGPNPDLAFAYVNELLGAEVQSKIAPPTFALPTNVDTPIPPGMPTDATIHPIDWAFVAENRNDWVKRWDREMGA
ncbi:MAG: ABC transporter substrate-binding protein [Methylocystis sp.]|nr:ABC transporter substrate-binding protein [Methylocystis sp.]MCA3585453.1 ABC transporter substrate-binding protein [Methylocystis sp.]MCA3588717.1 ABC transporter substrate-binding protein [Methylocystis sp.]MCA3592494.1 ABC transporter substrate-binding protein [Methylocystis sp.]